MFNTNDAVSAVLVDAVADILKAKCHDGAGVGVGVIVDDLGYPLPDHLALYKVPVKEGGKSLRADNKADKVSDEDRNILRQRQGLEQAVSSIFNLNVLEGYARRPGREGGVYALAQTRLKATGKKGSPKVTEITDELRDQVEAFLATLQPGKYVTRKTVAETIGNEMTEAEVSVILHEKEFAEKYEMVTGYGKGICLRGTHTTKRTKVNNKVDSMTAQAKALLAEADAEETTDEAQEEDTNEQDEAVGQ